LLLAPPALYSSPVKMNPSDTGGSPQYVLWQMEGHSI